MSWKRGLTRIYVVLWVVWGVGLGAFAVSDVLGVWNEAKYRSVLSADGSTYRFPSKATDEQITVYLRPAADVWRPASGDVLPSTITVTNQELAAALKRKAKSAPRPRSTRELMGMTPPPSSVLAILSEGWQPIARDERADAPWRYTFTTLGLWLGLGGVLAPGLLLATVRWVWAGFERSPEVKT